MANAISTAELLDRYLHAVKNWLPRAQRQDIVAEISEDLHAQIADQEAELGRPLHLSEVEATLKQFGPPLLVANSYRPQQSLIGPVWFPIYWLVLRIVALCCLVSWVLAWIGLMPGIDAHAYPVLHAYLSVSWASTLDALAMVTLIFAIIERLPLLQTRLLEDWNPRRLPAVRDSRRISRFSCIVDIVANAVFLVWWLPLHSLHAPLLAFFPFFFYIPLVPAIHITLVPVWVYFYWGFIFIAITRIMLSGTNLFRMVWSRTRAVLFLAIHVAAFGLFCWESKASILAAIQMPNLAPDKAIAITHVINLWLASAFPYSLAVGVVVLAFDLYRIFRTSSKDAPSTGAPSYVS